MDGAHNNFFNSQIKESAKGNNNRFRSNTNTLGFDIAAVKVPYNKATIITNGI